LYWDERTNIYIRIKIDNFQKFNKDKNYMTIDYKKMFSP